MYRSIAVRGIGYKKNSEYDDLLNLLIITNKILLVAIECDRLPIAEKDRLEFYSSVTQMVLLQLDRILHRSD